MFIWSSLLPVYDTTWRQYRTVAKCLILTMNYNSNSVDWNPPTILQAATSFCWVRAKHENNYF